MKHVPWNKLCVVLAAAALGVVAAPLASHAAGALKCLTGTDPSVSNDKAQIAAVRALVDSICPCAHFDGTTGNTHGTYVKCTGAMVTVAVALGDLRPQCRGTVKRFYAQSTCGMNPNLHSEPCISTKTSNGKVTCSIKPTTKKDGTTPSPACSSTATTTRVVCSAYTTCIDAADANHDFLIGAPGDTGTCVPQGKYVFISSQAYTGNLGGLTGADTKCQDLANTAALVGTYKAWLSSSTASASSRLTASAIPYILVDGTLIANNFADLTNGNIAAALNKTESGATLNDFIWTGSAPDGTACYQASGGCTRTTPTTDDGGGFGRTACMDWTASVSQSEGVIGISATDAQWTAHGDRDCTDQHRLYCIQQ